MKPLTVLLTLLVFVYASLASPSLASWRYESENGYGLIAEQVTIVELTATARGYRMIVDAPLLLAPPNVNCRFVADGRIPIIVDVGSTLTPQQKLMFALATTAMVAGKRVSITGNCNINQVIILTSVKILE